MTNISTETKTYSIEIHSFTGRRKKRTGLQIQTSIQNNEIMSVNQRVMFSLQLAEHGTRSNRKLCKHSRYIETEIGRCAKQVD